MIKKDTLNYTCKVYYQSGQLRHETTISNNKFIGSKKSFFENGSVERIEELFQPTPLYAKTYDCYIINYRADGTKESEYQYRNDKLNGDNGDDSLDGGAGTDSCNGGTHVSGDTATACETTTNVP